MKSSRNNTPTIIFSVLLHVIVLLALITSFTWSSQRIVFENTNQQDVISAVVMSATPAMKPIVSATKPKPNIQPEPKPTPPTPVKPIEKVEKPAINKVDDAIALRKQQEKKQKMVEQQLLADIKKQKIKPLKKPKHDDIAKAFEQEIKALKAQSLQQQLKAENNRVDALKSAQSSGIVDKYKAMILQTIGQHWIVPPGADKSLTAELLIRLAPGGTVLDVQLVKSSGDPALDSSARAAVFKSSPLPVPDTTEEFNLFKQFTLKVKPENIYS